MIDNTKQHAQYLEYLPLMQLVSDTMRDDLIKKNKKTHLPIPNAIQSRMAKPELALLAGKAYDELGEWGELPSVTSETLNEIIGVFFVNPLQVPNRYEDEKVTNTGKTVKELVRSVVKNISLSGRRILVIDAPEEGGEPFIAEYSAKSMEDWRVDKDGNLIYVKLYEGIKDKKKKYRIYENANGVITSKIYFNNELQNEYLINLNEMPVIPIGSIDYTPEWDEIPLLKTAQAMRQYYRLSCYYNRALSRANDYTTTASGVSESEADNMMAQGSGHNALWYSERKDAKWSYLEVKGEGIAKAEKALETTEKRAKEYGMQFIAGANEAAETVRMRKEAKLMSISTVADSCGRGVTKALDLLSQLKGAELDGEVVINLPSTAPLFTLEGVKSVKIWADSGLLPDEVAYNQQKNMGAFENTSIKTFDDYKKIIKEQSEGNEI